MEHSDSREDLFDSSLNSVNTELPMSFSCNTKKEKFDFLHFYGEMNDDDFHRIMSIDDLTYSTEFSDEIFDNGEWHTYAGLFSLAEDDNDVYLDSDDGVYISADESLEGTLDASFKSFPCTEVSAWAQHRNVDSRSVTEFDPGADLVSSGVPDPSDKWEENDDLGSFCIFDEMPLEPCDSEVILSSPIDFVGSSTDAIDYAEDFLRRHSTLEHLLTAKLPDECDNANFIWSILTDKLLYCQSDTSDSVRHFSHDSLKANNAKQRFFDAALKNEPCFKFITY